MIASYFLGRMNILPTLLTVLGINELNNYDVAGDTRFTFTGFLLTLYLSFLLLVVDSKTIYLKILILGVVLLNIFAFTSNMTRVCWSFLIIQVLFFTIITIKSKNEKYVLLIKMSFLLYAILNYIQFILADQGKILPYNFSIE